jgi:hypothetical protein
VRGGRWEVETFVIDADAIVQFEIDYGSERLGRRARDGGEGAKCFVRFGGKEEFWRCEMGDNGWRELPVVRCVGQIDHPQSHEILFSRPILGAAGNLGRDFAGTIDGEDARTTPMPYPAYSTRYLPTLPYLTYHVPVSVSPLVVLRTSSSPLAASPLPTGT